MGTILEAKDTVVGKVPALMEQVFFFFFSYWKKTDNKQRLSTPMLSSIQCQD